MSYLDRMNEYRQKFESGRNEAPSSMEIGALPPDQTQNIFNDNMDIVRDKLAENITAPITTGGSIDLLRRGFNKLPAVQDIKDAYQNSKTFVGKLKGVLQNEDLQGFLDDPEGALKNFAAPLKQKVIDAVNEGVESAKSQALNVIGDVGDQAADLSQTVGDKIANLSDALPTGDEAAELTQKLASAAGEGLGQGIQKGIFGTGGSTSQAEAPEVVDEGGETESDFNDRFQASLNEDGQGQTEHLPQAGQTEAEAGQQSQASLDPAEEDEFLNDGGGAPRDFMGELKDGAGELNDALGDSNLEAFKSLLDRGPVGESADASRAPVVSSDSASVAENAERANISSNIRTSDGLTQALDSTEASEADLGSGGMSDILGKVAGEEAPEVSTALGIGDFIPGLGEILDVGSIGAMIGESVDFYKNKANLEKAQQEETNRQNQVQKDISEEQSTLVQQGRDEAAQQDQARQSQAVAATPLPVSQAGTDIN